MRQTDDLIDCGNFSSRGYLPLIRKDSVNHMHGPAVCVKEGLPFARHFSLENSVDSYYVFDWLYFIQCLTFFFSIDHLLHLYALFFNAILSNIDEALLINPFAKVFVFGDFNIHYKNWLTYSGGTDRPGELCYNFCISNDLT